MASSSSIPQAPLTDCRIMYNAWSAVIPPLITPFSCCQDSRIVCDAGGRITSLNFANHVITGSMPDLSGLDKLETLDMRSANLTGQISPLPNSLTSLLSGFLRFLSNNHISGALPSLPEKLVTLLAENNLLTGPLPTRLPESLSSVVLSNNQILGLIPPVYHGVKAVNLDGNCFHNYAAFNAVNNPYCSADCNALNGVWYWVPAVTCCDPALKLGIECKDGRVVHIEYRTLLDAEPVGERVGGGVGIDVLKLDNFAVVDRSVDVETATAVSEAVVQPTPSPLPSVVDHVVSAIKSAENCGSDCLLELLGSVTKLALDFLKTPESLESVKVSAFVADPVQRDVGSARVKCSPPWDSGKVYLAKDGASVGGINYVANWWSQGISPPAAVTDGSWSKVGACDGTISVVDAGACSSDWISGATYTAGQQASVGGVNYRAKWWTQQNPVGSVEWEKVGVCAIGPTTTNNPGDVSTTSSTSAIVVPSVTTGVPVVTTKPTPGPSSGFNGISGPKKVIYNDNTAWVSPGAAYAASIGVPGYANTEYNVINLAFWLRNGPYDASYYWSILDSATKQSYVEAFHTAGKAVLVSAFGATDMPTGADPVATANQLADFVVNNLLDGADIDWEDNDSMNNGSGEAWLIKFTQALRQRLPSPRYIISHAPQAPYFFDNKAQYPNGAYLTVHQAVGDLIDFYNVQFYNQGSTDYESCGTLLFNANGYFTGTSLFEIAAKGVPLNKLVIGKPVTRAGVVNSGYMDPGTLSTCVSQAVAKGWSGGVMGWEWNLDTPAGSWISTVAAGLSADTAKQNSDQGGVPPIKKDSRVVLLSGQSSGTYYYDYTGRVCPQDKLGGYPENDGYTFCEPSSPSEYMTLGKRQNNNIVAIDASQMKTNKAKLCGKRINLKYNGVSVEGKFVVWDACQACIGGVKIDLSVSALTAINSSACQMGVVPGISWEVVDEQVIPYKP